MPIITHKFHDYQPDPNTEILILGTFIHDREDSPDFFYGRTRNFLWHLLPICYNLPEMKEATLEEKKQFMAEYKIDFADVINTLEVEEGEEDNSDDNFIDASVSEWRDLITLVDSLPNLKAVYFTRKTFNSIPAIRTQVTKIAKHCIDKGIRFCKLETPSKFYDPSKQQQWKNTIFFQTTCLRV